jgi:hypothetical protein
VKLLNDETPADHDGSEFRGALVDSVLAGDKVIVHAESEVRGILVLLRSKIIRGFSLRVAVTSLTDHEKTYDLTLVESFVFDAGTPAAANSRLKCRESEAG